MEWAIVAENLTKVYEQPQGWRQLARPVPVTAVADIHLTIPPGELFGLLGPNGAGKTTLVKMLCTLIQPTSGQAWVAGHALARAGDIRAAVGLVVSDERSFFWRLSARRNLDFFAALHGLHGQVARQRVTQVLNDVDLLDVAERRFSNFSSGMRQRLAIARALLHHPRILFLDEPSRSLDPRATQRLHDLIRRLQAQREMTIFLITHDLAEAEKLCDRVALLHQGRIQASGPPDALRAQLQPQRAYQVTVNGVPTAVLDQLRTRFAVTTEPLSGQQVRITLQAAEGDGRLTAVLHLLQQHHCLIHHIDVVVPTLEEVFSYFTKN